LITSGGGAVKSGSVGTNALRCNLKGRNTAKNLSSRRITHVNDNGTTISIRADHGVLWAICAGGFFATEAKALLAILFFGNAPGFLSFEGALLAFGFCNLAEAIHARSVTLLGSAGTGA
jgi:hypothetical protein